MNKYTEAKKINRDFSKFIIIEKSNLNPSQRIGAQEKRENRIKEKEFYNPFKKHIHNPLALDLCELLYKTFKGIIKVSEITDDIIEIRELQKELWQRKKIYMR